MKEYIGYSGRLQLIFTDPIEYRGYKIFERAEWPGKWGNVFDIVINGKCISQYAGINGAKGYIDSILDGKKEGGSE